MSIIAIALATRPLWRRRRSALAEESASALTAADFITGALRGSHRALLQAVETLSQEDLTWRPYPQAASVGFLLWHVARVQDAILHRQLLTQPELWMSQGWAQRFGLASYGVGQDHTDEQRAGFHVPPKPDLLAYLTATYDAALRGIESMDTETLDVETEAGMQRVRYLVILVNHANMHAGAINYIRDLLNASREVSPEL
ncbi:MAG: DinB family protein [Chloroflexi bacterium]|nr:DinB family protein [Chloroflexota bacterium]